MSVISKVYINNIYQGETEGLSWPLNKIYTTPAPFGHGYYLPLPYFNTFTWRVDAYDTNTKLTTTGTDWYFTTKQVPSLVPSRATNYQPDKVWAWTGTKYDWVDTPDIILSGGGRYGQNLVVIGNGTVYYGEL
jgi:hypothetical protein